MPGMEADIKRGLNFVLSLKNPRLKEFARYYFELNVPNLFKKKTAELIDLLQPKFMECMNLGTDVLDGDGAEFGVGVEEVGDGAEFGVGVNEVNGVEIAI